MKRDMHFCSLNCLNESQRLGGLIDGKKKKIFEDRFGVDNPLKSCDILNRVRSTCIERYGHSVSSKNDDVKQRMRETVLRRYGVDSFSKHKSFNEKRIKTCMKKWGVDHNMKSLVIWKKNHESRKKNGSFARSKIESIFIDDLRKIFGKIVKDQIVIDAGNRRWVIDAYLSNLDVYVQFDGVYWHGLDRPIEHIRESKKKQDASIYRAWLRDREQDKWFVENGKRLIRITDRQYKMMTAEMIETLIRSNSVDG